MSATSDRLELIVSVQAGDVLLFNHGYVKIVEVFHDLSGERTWKVNTFDLNENHWNERVITIRAQRAMRATTLAILPHAVRKAVGLS